MILAKVVGNVWATRKEETLIGLKFLVVRPVTIRYDKNGVFNGLIEQDATLVVADRIGAGQNEIVMIASGSSARQSFENSHIPVDAMIIGIIDDETFSN